MFTLVLDNVLVKINSKEYAQQLINTRMGKYKITIYWDEKLYIGITLKWWYNLKKDNYLCPHMSRTQSRK